MWGEGPARRRGKFKVKGVLKISLAGHECENTKGAAKSFKKKVTDNPLDSVCEVFSMLQPVHSYLWQYCYGQLVNLMKKPVFVLCGHQLVPDGPCS